MSCGASEGRQTTRMSYERGLKAYALSRGICIERSWVGRSGLRNRSSSLVASATMAAAIELVSRGFLERFGMSPRYDTG